MSATAVSFVLVCGIGALNSLFLAGDLLVRRKGTAAANRLLAALILTFSVRVIKAVVLFFVAGLHPLYEFLWIALLGMTGPCALLYLWRLHGPGTARPRRVLGAMLGAAAVAGMLYAALPLNVVWKLMAAALGLYGTCLAVVFPSVSWRKAGDAGGLAARWRQAVVLFLTAIWGLHAALIVRRLAGPVVEDRYFEAEAIVFSLAIYALFYGELRHAIIARVHRDPAGDRLAEDGPIVKRVRQAVEVERLYLDPSLSLGSLAAALHLSPQHLSRVINGSMGVGFNDYLNRLRVQEAMRLLSLPDGAARKIGALGFDCGFNTPSVFYAAFKKFAGKTPTEYLRDLSRT